MIYANYPVMLNNSLEVRFYVKNEVIQEIWVETGIFYNYQQNVVLELNTIARRQLILNLNLDCVDHWDNLPTQDHILTENEIWALLVEKSKQKGQDVDLSTIIP